MSELNVKSERLVELKNILTDYYNKFNQENLDLNLLTFAIDKKTDDKLSFVMLNENDVQGSLIEIINQGIGDPENEDNDLGLMVINALAEYMMRLCAQYPTQFTRFKEGVQYFKNILKEMNETENKEQIDKQHNN